MTILWSFSLLSFYNRDMNAKFDITGIRIENERLLLREWRLSDVDDMYEYASVPDVGERAGWPPHKNKEESLYYFLCRQ